MKVFRLGGVAFAVFISIRSLSFNGSPVMGHWFDFFK